MQMVKGVAGLSFFFRGTAGLRRFMLPVFVVSLSLTEDDSFFTPLAKKKIRFLFFLV